MFGELRTTQMSNIIKIHRNQYILIQYVDPTIVPHQLDKVPYRLDKVPYRLDKGMILDI